MANVVIDIAAQFTGNKAFAKAESSTKDLEKSVGKLAKQFAGLFAASKLYSFGKASVKAFAADEKASRSLALALANTGNAFAKMDVESFIQRMQRTTGVIDDQLRPAFRTLLTATGDVKKSQDGLALALDISAGTGKDLSAVSMALAKAYGGQTTALSRLGAGLSKATLKAGDMDQIIAELQSKFAGQALEATKGFSGQLDLLAVAAENAKEAIGKGLIDSINILTGGNGGVGGAVGAIDKLSNGIAESSKNIAYMIKQFKALLPVIGLIAAALLIAFAPVTAAVAALAFVLAKGGQNLKKAAFAKGVIPGGMGNVSMTGGSNQDVQKSIKLQKQQNELKKIDNALTTRKLTLTADQQALEELKKKFDVERIGLSVALNEATDRETQLRILSLMAIHDNDEALAGKIKAEIEATKAIQLLGDSALAAWGKFQSIIGQGFKNAAPQSPYFGLETSQPYQISDTPLYSGGPGDIPGLSGTRGFSMAGASSPTYIINASGIGDQQIASVVQGAIQDLNRYGSSTTYAGAI
jgi:hypothetical protein